MSKQHFDSSVRAETRAGLPLLATALLVIILVGVLAYFGIALLNRLESVETKLTDLGREVAVATEKSEQALRRASEAEQSALEAARGWVRAEAEAAGAQEEAEAARQHAAVAEQEADIAREEARVAREEAERIKQEWQREVDRLHDALNQIVDTRKTALGLVLNLSEDYLKFDFDKATLRPENRELLSRIAGILLTSKDYSIAVYGHTDDIGTEEYNQRLSERRAKAVRDYLVEAGLDPAIVTTEGFGKTQPLVPEKTPEARAKNRRVEVGIVNTRINYGPSVSRPKE
jgi:outer membrane protein OmpA-like peptidoglycan-associated protein